MFKSLTVLLLAALTTGAACAQDAANLILERLRKAEPKLEYSTPVASRIPGLYEVQINGGPRLYVTAAGDFFVAGQLFQVMDNGFTNLAEVERQKERAVALKAIPAKEMIIFPPKGETKSVVWVFTDVDCGYCRKLHNEMADINARGIEVRYLAFPRAGDNSETARKMINAFCAEDPRQALTALKRGENIPSRSCANPVAKQYALGHALGVEGTPALITEKGEMLPGYMPADKLAEALGVK